MSVGPREQLESAATFPKSTFDQRYTESVRAWLDRRFSCVSKDLYVAHEPIWGIPSRGLTEGGHARRAARAYDVLVLASQFHPETLLDVGGAEGYLASLAQSALGIKSVSADLSIEACARATELCGVASISLNASCLPFEDDASDVVTITEVIEHLVDPIGALLEARRVARKAVIVSTEEFFATEVERAMHLEKRTLENHGERNVFCRSDFQEIFHGLDCSRRHAHTSSLGFER